MSAKNAHPPRPSSKYPFLEEREGVIFIKVRVQPRGSRDSIEGVQGALLKVRLTAPPVEGEANRRLIEFLSETLGVRKSALSITAGDKSRQKCVRVEGIGLGDIERAFSRSLPDE